MDGNGRWARERSLPRNEGHRAGVEAAREVAQCCVDWGIPYLTLYAFSTENKNRPRSEVSFLMDELASYLRRERKQFVDEGVRVRAIGRIDELPAKVRKELERTEQTTGGCDRLNLMLALNYGGRAEIADAARAIAQEVSKGVISAEDVDEALVGRRLYTPEVPELDMLIRTGGQRRVSNFLLWQLYYAELYFTDVLWPDFRREQLLAALRDFASRERKFGRLEAPEQ